MIIKLTIEDIDDLVKLEKKSFLKPWSYNELTSDFLHNPFANFYGIKVEDYLMAYIGVYDIYERVEISSIAVDPSCRKQGFASELIGYIIDKAIKSKQELISLEVRVSNIPAINLYSKMGFKKTRTIKAYYQDNFEDAYEMTRILGDKNEKDISD